MIIKKIQHTALRNYWINKKLDSGRKIYFSEIFLPEFITSINKQLKISRHFDLEFAFNQSPVKGLISSIFDPKEGFFNSLDLAVALNIALNGTCNPKYKKNGSIANYVNFICEEFKNAVGKDKILNEHLKDLKRKIADFDYQKDVELLQTILSSRVKIFNTYFKKFQDNKYNRGITIYQQSSSDAWVDWNPENSMSINHNLIKFRHGFFLKGFDYQLTTGEELKVAAMIGDYEYFNPSKFDRQKELIWASEQYH